MAIIQGFADKKRFVFILLLALIATNIQSVSANPPECLVYAYTSDDDHKFLLSSNSNMYNDQLYIIHNCESVKVYVDNMFVQSSESNMSINIDSGVRNITFEGNNMTFKYQNVNFLESRFDWLDQYNFYIDNLENKEYSNDEVKILTNWVAIGTGFTIFFLSVGVYWRLINYYVDRNYVEEIQ